ncbi:DUF1801 domain-containing protein [Micromonospora sp. STR1_7]|uniref:DUF1801 domain-containing protein n=1 Tax=Micromonospora parastrephiae TaxID=2806101 RepID=A0ABS1XQ53_9ACTN|nr:DUF1801 domain-containing protein [Micromonospora parastrephiae]MBM0231373.1 DUF1801 domain-containing protein [Micromonospora parastrephiae]
MTNHDVDGYVRRLPAEQSGVVAALRELMRESAPGAREVISRGSLAWQGAKLLAILSLSKTHVTFAFARGAEFTDHHGLLAGVGKTTRHVKLKPADSLPGAALRDYIHQAVLLDQG